jgi:hypothetical protein
MPIIARGFDDLLLDDMAAKLETFRAREAAIDAAADFDITRDNPRPYDCDRPLVNLRLEGDSTESRSSASRRQRIGRLTIKVECWAPRVASRLHYLKAQTLAALYALTDPDFKQAAGAIGEFGFPNWAPIPLDDTLAETDVYAGEWTIEVTYAWTPEDIIAPDLAELSIDTVLWAAEYTYGT